MWRKEANHAFPIGTVIVAVLCLRALAVGPRVNSSIYSIRTFVSPGLYFYNEETIEDVAVQTSQMVHEVALTQTTFNEDVFLASQCQTDVNLFNGTV
jgi:hypothetical protein